MRSWIKAILLVQAFYFAIYAIIYAMENDAQGFIFRWAIALILLGFVGVLSKEEKEEE